MQPAPINFRSAGIVVSVLIGILFIDRPNDSATAQIPDNFKRENLVAWCIVPFDARNRDASARTAMLNALGLHRCAYDWRSEHVPLFETEILEYQKQGIEFFAFWDQEATALALFQKHKLTPQIWKTLGDYSAPTRDEAVAMAVRDLMPLVKLTAKSGSPLGLYNHGGWGGEPENMIAVCKALRELGYHHVGLVYNFHHGHGHIRDFAEAFQAMQPFLLCVNLNGMLDLNSPRYRNAQASYKIRPIGSGDHERQMIQIIRDSNYTGPIGVLGHVAERDVAEVLRENIEGLEWILGQREKPEWLQALDPPPVADQPLVKLTADRQVLDARLGFLNIDAGDGLDEPGFSVQCRSRLFDKSKFNILVAKNPKSSSTHWELYSYAQSGELSFYVPGYLPAEIKSGINVADGKWHDLAVDFQPDQVTLHVDGRVVHRQAIQPAAGLDVNSGPLTVGSLASQQVGCDGQLESVRLLSIPAARSLGEWSFHQAATTDEIRDQSDRRQSTDFVQTSFGSSYLSKWTPKSRQNSRFPYEDETDPDWVDDRFSRMNTGPFLNQSIEVPGRGIVPKAIAVKAIDSQTAHYLFDTDTLNLVAAWTGEFIALPPARFGILQTPSVAGSVAWRVDQASRWRMADPNTNGWTESDRSNSRFIGTRLVGDTTLFEYRIGQSEILELPTVRRDGTISLIERKLWTASVPVPIQVPLFAIPATSQMTRATSTGHDQPDLWVWRGEKSSFVLRSSSPVQIDGYVYLELQSSKDPKADTNAVWYGEVPNDQLEQAIALLKLPRSNRIEPADWPDKKNLTRRWGDPLFTAGVPSRDSGPFVVDTLTVPYENRYGALMFTSGFDFLPDGRAFVCTVHGDVWLVSGIDDQLTHITWQRFATGLYQPLGLKVIDGKPIVLCRDRLTLLEDDNRDGEADRYLNFNDDLVITGQNHGYAMSLETDPEGNFYFIKSGNSAPHGGTMLKVAPDGRSMRVVATGYRHANGLGVSPTGIVTSADNEGNWIPSTRIDVVQPGGFYGHLPTHRRDVAPESYDPPLMWLPRSMDNSAGGQVWINNPAWGALNGLMVHLSFGRCTANVVLPQSLPDGSWQAAAYAMKLPLFLSGSMRGRFGPIDGNLYVCGLDGWQTAAVRDGCLQRIRATGEPFCLPVGFQVAGNRIRIRFSEPLDAKTASVAETWQVAQWNYRWSEAYGSDHYSVAYPDRVGHDDVPVRRVTLSPDGTTATLEFEKLQPVMQMNIQARLKSARGGEVDVDLYNTIHGVD